MAVELIEMDQGRVLLVRVSGSLSTADYAPFVAEAEGLIAEWGRLRLLVELHDIKAFSLGALWEDLKFDLKHFGDVERLAVVGETHWQLWMTEMAKVFVSGDVKFFSASHMAEARVWLLE
ncbi:MAG: STAS/SEC14 domain-containing protein [Verrucomicrobiae bacterium]|jgi:hypothetical protein|nr:STAS/SEC14 domain-containing protein [Verrucomicrobiae bacterium]